MKKRFWKHQLDSRYGTWHGKWCHFPAMKVFPKPSPGWRRATFLRLSLQIAAIRSHLQPWMTWDYQLVQDFVHHSPQVPPVSWGPIFGCTPEKWTMPRIRRKSEAIVVVIYSILLEMYFQMNFLKEIWHLSGSKLSNGNSAVWKTSHVAIVWAFSLSTLNTISNIQNSDLLKNI